MAWRGPGSCAPATGDEVARRRVWSRLEGLPSGKDLPARRARSLALPALVGALVAVSVVAVLWVVPATRPTPSSSGGKAGRSCSCVGVPAWFGGSPGCTPGFVCHAGANRSKAGPRGTGWWCRSRARCQSVLSWDAERRPSVERGQARFEVPHQAPGERFAVSAGPYLISVVGQVSRGRGR